MPDSQPLPLRDIHLPDAISWWPLAPGWWAAVLLLLLITGVMVWLRRSRLRRRLRTTALRELAALRGAYQQHQDDRQLVSDLSVLLRRICISVYPPQQVAGLTGETWLRFLDRGVVDVVTENDTSINTSFDAGTNTKLDKSDGAGFTNGPGRVLLEGPYQANVEQEHVDAESLLSLCQRWIRQLPMDGAGLIQ